MNKDIRRAVYNSASEMGAEQSSGHLSLLTTADPSFAMKIV